MLKIHDLSLLHHPVQELLDVNLSVGRGEVCVVVGPNGGGKELLTQVIADPSWEHSGEIIINHFNLSHDPGKAKYHLGYASSAIELEPYLTGYEQLDFWGSVFGLAPAERSKRIIELSGEFGFSANLYHLTEVLSEADRQKIRLIASLLHRPSVVVWNEPTEYLDPADKQLLADCVEQLRHDKNAVLIACNDLDFAQHLADNVVVLQNGKISANGNIAELKNQSQASTKSLAEIYSRLVG